MNSSFISFDEALVSGQFLADPYPILLRLRQEDPVHWSEAIGGWVLTRYDDIVATFKDTTHYSNEGRLARAVEHLPSESRAKFKAFEEHYRTRGLLHSDPPDHTRLRALVTKAFTPRVVEAMQPRIRDVANELLDSVQSHGQMDVIGDLAVMLPITVVAEIMGMPASDKMLAKGWADALLAFQGVNNPSEEILRLSQETLIEIRAYLAELVRRKRREPGTDLVSQMVAAESEGDKLSESELINTCITLLVAGHETSTSLIGNGIFTLLHNQEQWRLLQNDISLLSSAIEEILRYESPVSRQPRLMKADAELEAKTLRRGEMVFQMLNAANRDPAHFSEPDRFDIRRQKNRHIAFGFGIHFCVGALLARTEANIVFRLILERFPKIRLLDAAPDWDVHKRNSRMLRTLRVIF
jgi:pimeloyl-[acyl-carrier protein] synthase